MATRWSWKIDKYEHLTAEEVLPSDQGYIIEQTEFTSKKFTKIRLLNFYSL